ncbi:hypothetical protein K504DRAFT_530789 [Pleomassaria siparia CBS 279.74]|uniref:DNA-binding protein RAP1 n=1 Tax=Pleomassaria siparia CBS 279.74 TaxID=1314801 RepID=A0A6G1KNH2_9PLEO|nr:hypothetical protein K504DRAFT_530789 [Pleomassaria siparia CBS 279.74]
MAAPIVYTDLAEDANLDGKLFAGLKFWVAQRIPSRNHYLGLIRDNGGIIEPLEKKADYRIADHIRSDCPVGSISYTFIDDSIKKGELASPDRHLAGPEVGTARHAGSISRPKKGVRTPYTAEEDRILYKWVRDCETNATGVASGNAIYKQLEVKYPQHTWQSWRDHYLKALQHRPPSAFNIPDNAPPSPPSDPSPKSLPPNRKTSKEGNKSASASASKSTAVATKKVATQPRGLDSGHNKKKERDDYTEEELADMFDEADWENLYANVPLIIEHEDADDVWESWATTTHQTAQQWKQFFWKTVKPQWERDPISKRDEARIRFEEKYSGSEEGVKEEPMEEPMDEVVFVAHSTRGKGSLSSQQDTTAEPSAPKPKPNPTKSANRSFNLSAEDPLVQKYYKERRNKKLTLAYWFYSREKKFELWATQPDLDYTKLHQILKPRWDALSDQDKAPYVAMEVADRRRIELEAIEQLSEIDSSTIAQETPQYITEAFDKPLKRPRSTMEEYEEESDYSARQTKRSRPENLPSDSEDDQGGPERDDDADLIGSQWRPLEISSKESSSALDSQNEIFDEPPDDQTMEDTIQLDSQTQKIVDDDEAAVIETSESAEVQTPSLEDLGHPYSSNYPSNTPTLRTPRQQKSSFNTQAILSSPIEDMPLGRLPRPPGMTQPRETNIKEQNESQSSSIQYPSPIRVPESIASPSQSLDEFRHSLNGTAPSEMDFALNPISRPTRVLSPTLSVSSSSNSDDPDPPLAPDELDEYFDEAHENGFTDAFVIEALKHTRCRPGLADEVLEAWNEGKPLPDQRGIWSKEDDSEVEGGNAVALARLKEKHTVDGWGGITERLRFLEQYRRPS